MIHIEISEEGKISFIDVSAFVLFKWNYKVLQEFMTLVEQSRERLLSNPELGKPFTKSIRKIILHKNASFYYEFNENLQTITILLFIDNRTNPKEYLKLL